jgi:hypothetical protein
LRATGATEAAMMSANTTGMMTIGAWAMTKIATAKTPSAASTRQLHWARRSIHPATSRFGLGPVSGSSASTSAPPMATANATTGIAAKTPTMPAIAAPAGMAMMMIAGCRCTDRP